MDTLTSGFIPQDTIKEVENLVQDFRPKVSKYKVLCGAFADHQGHRLVVMLTPLNIIDSGCVDGLTGVQIPVGAIKIVDTTVEGLSTKLTYIDNLLNN